MRLVDPVPVAGRGGGGGGSGMRLPLRGGSMTRRPARGGDAGPAAARLDLAVVGCGIGGSDGPVMGSSVFLNFLFD